MKANTNRMIQIPEKDIGTKYVRRKDVEQMMTNIYAEKVNALQCSIEKDVIVQCMGIILHTLATDFEFDNTQLREVFNAISRNFSFIGTCLGKEVTPFDFVNIVKKEYGIDLINEIQADTSYR